MGDKGEGSDLEEGKELLECQHCSISQGEWSLCRHVYYVISHQQFTLRLSNLL